MYHLCSLSIHILTHRHSQETKAVMIPRVSVTRVTPYSDPTTSTPSSLAATTVLACRVTSNVPRRTETISAIPVVRRLRRCKQSFREFRNGATCFNSVTIPSHALNTCTRLSTRTVWFATSANRWSLLLVSALPRVVIRTRRDRWQRFARLWM